MKRHRSPIKRGFRADQAIRSRPFALDEPLITGSNLLRSAIHGEHQADQAKDQASWAQPANERAQEACSDSLTAQKRLNINWNFV
jgi:hypothetical protein